MLGSATAARERRSAGLECGNSSKPPLHFPLVLMKHHAGPLVAWAALSGALCAQSVHAEPLSLKLSREIDVVAPRPASPSAGGVATGPATAIAPATPVPSATAAPSASTTVQLPQIARDREARGALFLRADRLEGDNRMVTAEGNVQLRTRRETVLADHLSYSLEDQTIFGKGNVVLRRSFDWITGPEVQYKRDTEVGFFRKPRFFISEANAHGDAAEIRFNGPDHYEATDASYTTCVAAHPDWYLRGEELEVDNLRKVGTAHRVSVHFLDVPVLYAPWLQFPLSNERKSGFLTPTLGSTGVRGFEATTPYYLNLAPNYDATITPRLMTKRGLQLGAQFRYLFGDDSTPFEHAAGELNAEILPHDRATGENRYALAWTHTEQFAPWLGAFWNLNKVSDDKYFADFADRIAITSQKSLPRDAGLVATSGPWSVLVRAQSFQTLQDPNAPVLPPYNRLPQVLGSLSDTDWLGLTWSGTGEYARFSQDALAPTGERLVLYPTVAWSRQGAAVVLHGACGREHARIPARPADCRAARPASRIHDPDHERRCRHGVRARPESARHVADPDARAARLSTSTSRIGTRRTRRCSIRRSTISISRSSSPRTATSAATALATPTS